MWFKAVAVVRHNQKSIGGNNHSVSFMPSNVTETKAAGEHLPMLSIAIKTSNDAYGGLQHSAQAVAQARAENGGAASGIADGSPVRSA